MQNPGLYKALPQGIFTRLLTLAPGVAPQPISVTINVVAVDDAPRFEAISYVWGNSSRRLNVLCNGHSFSITTNLHNALGRVRLPDQPRVIWADALCINQLDLDERGSHVRHMGKIYAKAERVLVYIGEDPYGCGHEVKTIVEEVAQRIDAMAAGDIDRMPVLDANDQFLQDERWSHLAELVNRPWFSRAWVIQEVGLARNPRVLVGDVEFSYKDLTRLGLWQQRCAPQLTARWGVDFSSIHIEWLDWAADAREGAPKRTFLELLNQASWLGCADHRDHIYSLLGHPFAELPGGGGLVVNPDYHKPADEVYHELTVQLLGVPEIGLRILSAVEHRELPSSNFPSWVPTWRNVETACNFGIFPGFYYDASHGLDRGHWLNTDDHSRLNARGITLDVISDAIQLTVEEIEWSPSDKNSRLEQKWDGIESGRTASAYPSAAEAIDAFSLALVAGLSYFDSAEAPENIVKHRADFSAYWRRRTDKPQLPEDGDWERYWSCAMRTGDGHSFMTTEAGYCGIGPWIAEKGDICVVFAGATVPFVLRKVAGDGVPGWLLIGECYVHGFMTGEAVDLLKSGSKNLEDFALQ